MKTYFVPLWAVVSLCLLHAETQELFILWGLGGRWDGRLEVTNGQILKAEPYSFEPQYGDSFYGMKEQSVAWKSGVGGQFDGVHFLARLGPNSEVVLTSPFGRQALSLRDFPQDMEKIIPVKGKNVFLVIGRGDPAEGPKAPPRVLPLPRLFRAEKPREPVSLPADWWHRKQVLTINLSNALTGSPKLRRISNHNGRLYFRLGGSNGKLTGEAEVVLGDDFHVQRKLSGPLWIVLEPRWGRISVHVKWPGGSTEFRAPTTLVETRGPELLLNGEPFLVKGTLPRNLNDEDAELLKEMSANALRTRSVLPQLEKFGFMAIGMVGRGPGHICQKPLSRAEFLKQMKVYVERVKKSAPKFADSPCWLLAQLGNEQAYTADAWTGRYGHNRYGRLDYLLATVTNTVKPYCPMIPTSYSNNAQGYRVPDFIECYTHNTYLSKDRGKNLPSVAEFSKWQGCDQRPFVMTEWGANVYMPEVYLFAPNLPVFEKIHAWNYPNRWRTYRRAHVSGGTNYCLYDYDPAKAKKQVNNEWDQGYSKFGVMTFDRKPKLALWELWHLWRDFEIEPQKNRETLRIRFSRNYHARNVSLRVSGKGLKLDDFVPHSERIVELAAPAPEIFHWRIDYTTHGGLPMAATGTYPRQAEAEEFLNRLKDRLAFPFLKELFDAEIVSASGEHVETLAQMEREDGVVTVVCRKPNGTVYVTAFHRRRPKEGLIHEGISIDIAFRGNVVRVDEMTGLPLDKPVEVEQLGQGIRLRNLRVPFIARGYTRRSKTRIDVPVYLITP